MGAVYLAHDTTLDRRVALKVAKASATGSAAILKRMQAEAKAAAKIDHPSICDVYDTDEIDGIRFIAMQYVPGEDLKRYLSRVGRRRPSTEAARIVLQLVRALEAAHLNGVVHRDLKPENVMLKPDGTPVVMDFGLARQTTLSPDAGLTQAGMVLGSAAYMSPEQARGSRSVNEIDGRSDIYAIGVMFFEMLTGEWPFTGSSLEILGKKCVQEAPSPLALQPDVPAHLAAVCQKMIARSRDDRYASCTDVIAAFENADSSIGLIQIPTETSANKIKPRTPSKTIPSDTSIAENNRLASWWNRRSPAFAWASLGVAGFVCLFVLGNLLFRSNHRSARSDGDHVAGTDVAKTPAAKSPSSWVSRWSGPWRTVHLLETADVGRDAIHGEWKLSGGRLTQTAPGAAQFALPIDAPDEYSFSFEGTRSPATPLFERSLGIVVPMQGRPVMIRIDTDQDGGSSGLIASKHGDWEQSTIIPGQQLPDHEKFHVRCVVRKDSLDVFWQGRRRIHWQGNPANLDCPTEFRTRGPSEIGLVCQGHYEFARLRLAPLTMSADDEVDLLKLVDVKRDTIQNAFVAITDGIAATSLDRPMPSILELPVEPPEEYTLHVTAKRTSAIRHLIVGLVAAGQPFDALFDVGSSEGGGLELIDGRIARDGPTAIPGSRFVNHVAFDLECRVARNRIVVLGNGRLLIDWPVQVMRFGRTAAHTNSMGFILGSMNSNYEISRVRLAPPSKQDPSPQTLFTGQKIDLLEWIDCDRDAFKGKFTKNDDGSISTPTDNNNPRLRVPLELPDEYELFTQIESTGEGHELMLGLPASGGRGSLIVDGFEHSWTGLDVDAFFTRNVTSRHGKLLPRGLHDLTVRVARTGIQVECDRSIVINWRGNPRRLISFFNWNVPGKRTLALGSQGSSYRFTKLELRPLSTIPPPFPSISEPVSGDLLSIIDPERDSIDGPWTKEGTTLVAPWRQDDPSSALHVPFSLDEEFEISAKVQRRNGTDAFTADIPVGNHRCMAVFDGWSSTTERSGINWVDGTDPVTNRTGLTGKCIPQGQVTHLRVRVEREKQGRYRVRGFSGDTNVISWTGYPSQLTSDAVPLPDEKRHLLLRTNAGFAISELSVRPISAKNDEPELDDQSAVWPEVAATTRLSQDWPRLRKLSLAWNLNWFRLPANAQQLIAQFPKRADSAPDAKTTRTNLKMGYAELDRNPLNQLDWFGFRASTSATLPSGRYAVRTDSDDGIRVRVNGQTIFEHFNGRQMGRPSYTEFSLSDGTQTFEVDYFDLLGGNACAVEFALVK